MIFFHNWLVLVRFIVKSQLICNESCSFQVKVSVTGDFYFILRDATNCMLWTLTNILYNTSSTGLSKSCQMLRQPCKVLSFITPSSFNVQLCQNSLRSIALGTDGSSVWQVELSGCITTQLVWFNSPSPLQHQINMARLVLRELPLLQIKQLSGSTGLRIFKAFLQGSNQVKRTSSVVPEMINDSQHDYRD